MFGFSIQGESELERTGLVSFVNMSVVNPDGFLEMWLCIRRLLRLGFGEQFDIFDPTAAATESNGSIDSDGESFSPYPKSDNGDTLRQHLANIAKRYFLGWRPLINIVLDSIGIQ